MTFKGFIFVLRKNYKENISKIMFSLFAKNKNKKKVQELKNSHVGECAFIVCNGPSLKAADLDVLQNNNIDTFASNKINKIFPQTCWRPTYYMIADATYQHTLLDTMMSIPAKKHFYRNDSYLTTRKLKDKDCTFFHTDGNADLLVNCKFSENCQEVIYTVGTVTYAMIQLAVYMGYKDIYIIGCDNSYAQERSKDGKVIVNNTESYFAGSDKSDKDNIIATTWQMNIGYECARKYADAHGIHIYNATRGGHLEAFERVDFDSIFKNQ